MSNPTIVAGVRAVMAAGLATQRVVWEQFPNDGFNPATGDSAPSVQTTLDILLYDEETTTGPEGTQATQRDGIVILGDLPHPVEKNDHFTLDDRYSLTRLKPDPTGSIIEFRAKR